MHIINAYVASLQCNSYSRVNIAMKWNVDVMLKPFYAWSETGCCVYSSCFQGKVIQYSSQWPFKTSTPLSLFSKSCWWYGARVLLSTQWIQYYEAGIKTFIKQFKQKQWLQKHFHNTHYIFKVQYEIKRNKELDQKAISLSATAV